MLGPREFYFNFAGMQRGDVGNNGQRVSDIDYQAAIAARQNAPQTGPWQNGVGPASFADFDQNYTPINPANDAGAASSYMVRDGDTLQSIALALWGDSSLWYLIADANGLGAGQTLAAGVTLSIPNKVTNLHDTSSTFRVYDPNKAIGDVEPNVPVPQVQPQASHKKHGGCSGAAIIVAVIAIAVTVATSGAAASFFAGAGGLSGGSAAAAAAGAATVVGSGGVLVASSAGVAGLLVGGAVGSIVSQGLGIALGVQDKFSWGQVGLSAIGNLVGGELGGIKGLSGNSIGGSTFLTGAVRGALGNAITQGIGVATGLQSKFDWAGVAVAGIGGGATSWASSRLAANFPATFGQGGMANNLVSGMAGDIAGAATRSLLTGTDFGDNILADLPSVIANTVGNAIAAGLARRDASVIAQKIAHAQQPSSADAAIDDGVYRSGDPGKLELTGAVKTAAELKAMANGFAAHPTTLQGRAEFLSWLNSVGSTNPGAFTNGQLDMDYINSVIPDGWSYFDSYRDKNGFLGVALRGQNNDINIGFDGLEIPNQGAGWRALGGYGATPGIDVLPGVNSDVSEAAAWASTMAQRLATLGPKISINISGYSRGGADSAVFAFNLIDDFARSSPSMINSVGKIVTFGSVGYKNAIFYSADLQGRTGPDGFLGLHGFSHGPDQGDVYRKFYDRIDNYYISNDGLSGRLSGDRSEYVGHQFSLPAMPVNPHGIPTYVNAVHRLLPI